MKNYWYVARDNEIFIDIDSKQSRSIISALARIRGIIEAEKFPIRQVWLFPSRTENHYHIVITLKNAIPETYRIALQLYFFSDVFRTCNNIMRIEDCVPAAEVLISIFDWRKQYKFYRYADATCTCEGKHDYVVMEKCSAAKTLRGVNRAKRYFDFPVSPENFFQKKFGKIWNYWEN